MWRAIQAILEQTGATPISKTGGERWSDCGDFLKSQRFLLQKAGSYNNIVQARSWIWWPGKLGFDQHSDS